MALAGGCATGGSGERARTRPLGEGSGPVEIVADWDDLDAAMDVAAERNEMAVLNVEPRSETSRRYQLRTVAAEPVLVIVTRRAPGPSDPGQPQAMLVRAKVGRFGDAEREADLIAALRRRLEQLRGVDFRPL